MYSIFPFFSRAHTIVGVIFTQKRKNEAGEETAKSSLINLVDLAGRYYMDIAYYCDKIINEEKADESAKC